MSFASWLRSWKSAPARASSGDRRRPTKRPPRTPPLTVERLEDRSLLSVAMHTDWVQQYGVADPAGPGELHGIATSGLATDTNFYTAGQTVVAGVGAGFVGKFSADGSLLWAVKPA